MKRRSIFAAMAAAVTAVAQQFKGDGPEPDWRQCADPREYPSECGKKLAKNGQCPVCGTIAEPYRREEFLGKNVVRMDGYCFEALTNLPNRMTDQIVSVPCSVDDVPPSRRVDCNRCNCTFRQFAEEKRK